MTGKNAADSCFDAMRISDSMPLHQWLYRFLTGKISEARMNDAKLEGLETMIEFGQIDLAQATRHEILALNDDSSKLFLVRIS